MYPHYSNHRKARHTSSGPPFVPDGSAYPESGGENNVTEHEDNIRKALADIEKALREPQNYDEPDLEEIRQLQRSLRSRLCELQQEQEISE